MMVAYDFDPLPKPRKRPGRPPKWKQGTVNKHYYFPTDLAQKLKQLVQGGKFESEVEVIYHYVMFANKLDELFERIKRLETQLELKEKENEALRARIRILESENEELKQWKAKALELEKKLEELQVELIKAKSDSGSLKSERELKGGDEQKDVDLWSLVEEYKEIHEALIRQSGGILFIGKGDERKRIFREEAERREKKLIEKINAILEFRGIDMLLFWRTVNRKGLDEAKKLFGE